MYDADPDVMFVRMTARLTPLLEHAGLRSCVAAPLGFGFMPGGHEVRAKAAPAARTASVDAGSGSHSDSGSFRSSGSAESQASAASAEGSAGGSMATRMRETEAQRQGISHFVKGCSLVFCNLPSHRIGLPDTDFLPFVHPV